MGHRRARQRQHDRADAKKNILKPHRKQQWVIPPDVNAAFVATMEDVLESISDRTIRSARSCAWTKPRSSRSRPTVLIPAKLGQPARHDYEYERNGVANLFMVFAPLEGWRHVSFADLPLSIMPTCSGIRPIRIFQMRRKSCWCRIISTSTSQPRFMRPFPRPRPAGSSSASNGTTRPSTAAGSIWPNPNLAFSRHVLGSPHRRQANPRPRSHRMAGPPQQAPRQRRLAIHDRQRPRQAEETVPSVRVNPRPTSSLMKRFAAAPSSPSSAEGAPDLIENHQAQPAIVRQMPPPEYRHEARSGIGAKPKSTPALAE